MHKQCVPGSFFVLPHTRAWERGYRKLVINTLLHLCAGVLYRENFLQVVNVSSELRYVNCCPEIMNTHDQISLSVWFNFPSNVFLQQQPTCIITSRSFGHAHLWYHVRYRSIENVWQTATMVSIYKHSARALPYIRLKFQIQDVQKICYKVIPSSCESEKRLLSDGV